MYEADGTTVDTPAGQLKAAETERIAAWTAYRDGAHAENAQAIVDAQTLIAPAVDG